MPCSKACNFIYYITHTLPFFVFIYFFSIIAPKGKAVLPPHNTSTAPIEQSTYTTEAFTLPLLYLVSLSLNIAQLIAEQMAITWNNIARLVAEQVTLALVSQKTRNTQTPPNLTTPSAYEHQGTVITSVELLVTYETHSQDRPLCSTDA